MICDDCKKEVESKKMILCVGPDNENFCTDCMEEDQ